MKEFIALISEVTGISPEKILSTTQKAEVVEARQLCMYFYSTIIGYTETAKILNLKSHSTVMYGSKRIIELLEAREKRTTKLVDEVIKKSENLIQVTDLRNIPEEEKEAMVLEFGMIAGRAAMQLFYSIGLKTHMEWRVSNGEEEFILSFKKVIK